MDIDQIYHSCFHKEIKEIKKIKKTPDDKIKELKLDVDRLGIHSASEKSFVISSTCTSGNNTKQIILIPQNKVLSNNYINVVLEIKNMLNDDKNEPISQNLIEKKFDELFINASIDSETDNILSTLQNQEDRDEINEKHCNELIQHFITSPEQNKGLLSDTNLYKYLIKINNHEIVDNFYRVCKKLNYDVKQIIPCNKVQYGFFYLVENNIPLLKVYIENDFCSEFKTPFSENLLQFSIRTNNKEMFDYLIHLDPAPFDYSETTLWRDTPLHCAAASKNPDFMRILLKDIRFAGQEHSKNLFGLTPIDLATHEENKEIITLLEPISKLNVIKNKPKYINQVLLEEKFLCYLKIENRPKIKNILTEGGLCNGLSFLHLYYSAQDKENYFYNILEELCSWDGKEDSLEKQPEHLPEYKDRRELFEQFLNDVSLFQYSSKITHKLKQGIIQNSREEQYDLIKNKYSKIINVSSQNALNCDLVDLNYLTQILSLLCLKPTTSLLIHGRKHSISVHINEDGSYSYYDPNLNFRPIKFNSAKELAECIQKIKYRYIGERADLMQINISCINFNRTLDSNESKVIHKLPIEEIVSFCNNAETKINLLHAAAILNSEELFDKCQPSERRNQVMTADPIGKTPIDWALQMKYYAIAAKLIKELPLADYDTKRTYEIISRSKCNPNIVKILCDATPKKIFLKAMMKTMSLWNINDEVLTYIAQKYPDTSIDGKVTKQSIKKIIEKL